jgi:hypothetical protein
MDSKMVQFVFKQTFDQSVSHFSLHSFSSLLEWNYEHTTSDAVVRIIL